MLPKMLVLIKEKKETKLEQMEAEQRFYFQFGSS